MKLIKKTKLNQHFKRYDLEIANTHNFVAEGVIVHNTNCRVGLIESDENILQFMCGSHKTNRKEYDLYWSPLDDNMHNMIINIWKNCIITNKSVEIHRSCNSVIVYCEIFGPKIQDLHYGATQKDYRVFDISVNGIYMNWNDVINHCKRFNIPTVPELYRGPFSEKVLMEYTDGPTTMCSPEQAGKFKGREGVVVKPLKERHSDILNGRCILKSISAEYLGRKNAIDNA